MLLFNLVFTSHVCPIKSGPSICTSMYWLQSRIKVLYCAWSIKIFSKARFELDDYLTSYHPPLSLLRDSSTAFVFARRLPLNIDPTWAHHVQYVSVDCSFHPLCKYEGGPLGRRCFCCELNACTDVFIDLLRCVVLGCCDRLGGPSNWCASLNLHYFFYYFDRFFLTSIELALIFYLHWACWDASSDFWFLIAHLAHPTSSHLIPTVMCLCVCSCSDVWLSVNHWVYLNPCEFRLRLHEKPLFSKLKSGKTETFPNLSFLFPAAQATAQVFLRKRVHL